MVSVQVTFVSGRVVFECVFCQVLKESFEHVVHCLRRHIVNQAQGADKLKRGQSVASELVDPLTKFRIRPAIFGEQFLPDNVLISLVNDIRLQVLASQHLRVNPDYVLSIFCVFFPGST